MAHVLLDGDNKDRLTHAWEAEIMLRQATRLCLWCESWSVLGLSLGRSFTTHPGRPYAQLQHERDRRNAPSRSRPSQSRTSRSRSSPRPFRMALSQTVERPPSSQRQRSARPRTDAFGHLNRTQAPPGLERRREQSDHARERKPQRPQDRKRRSKSDTFHALKMQRSLAPVPYGSRSALKGQVDKIESFDQFPFLESVQAAIKDALPDLEYRHPTPSQAIAVPALLGVQPRKRMRSPPTPKALETFLLAAETGSGKTLAYLLPTIDAIKRQEQQEKEQAEEQARIDAEAAAARAQDRRNDIFAVPEPEVNKAVDPARPRAIILVPSAELVAQVGAVAKSLSHTVKFRTAHISAKLSATVIRNQLFNPNGVDIVISTPPLLASIAESNPNILARVRHLICDEADSLFDRSFKSSTMEILERAMPSLKQLVLCSATIPTYLDKYLESRFPDMQRLVTPNLHAIPRRVQLGVVDVNKDPYHGNKLLACADTIWKIGKAAGDYDPAEGRETVPTKRILVFVNEREDTEEVAAYLVKKGIDAVAFHRDTEPSRQVKALASFTTITESSTALAAVPNATSPTIPVTTSANVPTTVTASAITRRVLPNTKIIVATDLGSRGIDTIAVRHVILYDVPHNTIDFIHRLGRTGRMGRRGRGIVLLGRGDRADVVKEVREAMYKGEALI